MRNRAISQGKNRPGPQRFDTSSCFSSCCIPWARIPVPRSAERVSVPAHLPVPAHWARAVTWVCLRLVDRSLMLKRRRVWRRDQGRFGAGFWLFRVSGQWLWPLSVSPRAEQFGADVQVLSPVVGPGRWRCQSLEELNPSKYFTAHHFNSSILLGV